MELGFLDIGVEIMRSAGDDFQSLNNGLTGIQRLVERLDSEKEEDEAILDRLQATGFIEVLGTATKDLALPPEQEQENDGDNQQKEKFSMRIWQRIGQVSGIMLLGGGPKLISRIDAGCKAGWVSMLCRILKRVIRGTSDAPEGDVENDIRAMYSVSQALAFMCIFTAGMRGPATDALLEANADETVAAILDCKREEFFQDTAIMSVVATLVSRISGIFAREDAEKFASGPLLRVLPRASQLVIDMLAEAKAVMAESEAKQAGESSDAPGSQPSGGDDGAPSASPKEGKAQKGEKSDEIAKSPQAGDQDAAAGGGGKEPQDEAGPDRKGSAVSSVQLSLEEISAAKTVLALEQRVLPMMGELQARSVAGCLEGGGEELDRRVQTVMAIPDYVPSLIRLGTRLQHEHDRGGNAMGAILQTLGFLMIGPDPVRMKA